MILTIKEIAFLSQSFTDQTPIGLFANIKAVPDGTEYESLQKKGIINGETYDPNALSLLMGIAKPERCARFIVQNTFGIIEKYTYAVKDGLILAENVNGEFEINKVKNFNDVILGLGDFFGMSVLKSTDISVSMTLDEAMVLLAAIDIYRKNYLLDYAGKGTGSDSISSSEIKDELKNSYKNGLVLTMQNNFGAVSPADSVVDDILKKLVLSGNLIEKSGYQLNDKLAIFATTFLIANSLILTELYEMTNENKVITANNMFVTAGVHDILSISFDVGAVVLTALSASQMLTIIEELLNCPSIESHDDKPQEETSKNVASAATIPSQTAILPWVCSCGRSNTGNFCASCGGKKP